MESPDKSKLLAEHNLYVSLWEIRLIKQCIHEGSLWDLLESRCRSHPRMLDGLKSLSARGDWLERLDTSTKSTFFYLSAESACRPEVIRYASRIERLAFKGKVLITDDFRADADGFDHVLHFKPPFGPYPPELSETYPLNAEVPEEPDSSALKQALGNLKHLMEANPQANFTLRLKCISGEVE
jgi:7-cyano-7-deazaguanine tRNA-ribosyltransferase